MTPLELLYEADGLERFELPESVAALYGGSLGLPESCMFANFVATADGVVAMPSVPQSNKLIAGGSAADRFVMGLLRACADVVVIGPGTLAGSPGGLWTPEQAFPAAAEGFADLRRRLGRPPELAVAIVTGSGAIDPGHPVFVAGATVITTDAGAASLHGRLPAEAIVSLGRGPLDVAASLACLRERGHRRILSEAGPRLFGSMVSAGVVDELFLTVSPLLAGRIDGDERLGLVEGADLLPGGPTGARLLGVRRDGAHLFLRYGLTR